MRGFAICVGTGVEEVDVAANSQIFVGISADTMRQPGEASIGGYDANRACHCAIFARSYHVVGQDNFMAILTFLADNIRRVAFAALRPY